MLDWFKSTFFGALGPVLAFFASVCNPLIALALGLWQAAQFVYEMIGKGSAAFDEMSEKYSETMTLVGQSVFGNLPPQLASATGFLNAFLPITEALILVAIAVIFYTGCVVLRVVKSWIPTVS